MQKSKKIKSAVLPSELTLMKTGEGILKFSGYKPARTKVRKRTQYIFPDKEPYMENTELRKRLEKEVDEQIRHTEMIEEKILIAAEKKTKSSTSSTTDEEKDKVDDQNQNVIDKGAKDNDREIGNTVQVEGASKDDDLAGGLA